MIGMTTMLMMMMTMIALLVTSYAPAGPRLVHSYWVALQSLLEASGAPPGNLLGLSWRPEMMMMIMTMMVT
eukprot:9467784-Pyramimonas_sp.AAC.1